MTAGLELAPTAGETVTDLCPPLELPAPAEGPIADEPPTSLAEFLRWAKAKDPARYKRVLRKHKVNQHIDRDERSHEVLTDFREAYDPDRGHHEAGPVREINRRVYLEWTSSAWEQGT
jgi:hypothetical protein